MTPASAKAPDQQRQPSRTYALWLTSTTAQRYGAAVQALTVSLIVYALTGSTQLAGLLATVRGALAFALPFIGGVIVDHYDRRQLMLWRARANIVVWGLALLLFLLGYLSGGTFAVFVLLDGLIEGLLGGASEAALRSLVDGEDYARARAVNEARDASAQLLGSPIAGFLFSLWTFGAIAFGLVMDVIAGLAAFLLPAMPTRETTLNEDGTSEAAQSGHASSLVAEAFAGMAWMRRRPVMAALTILCSVASFGGFLYMSIAQLYLIAERTSAFQVGLVATAEGVGVLVGSPLASWLVTRVRTGLLAVGALTWSALCLLPVAFSPTVPIILVCSFLYALLVPALNAALGGFTFQHVPQDLQGRVGAAFNVAIGLPVAFAPAAAGLLVGEGLAAIGVILSAVILTIGAGMALLVPSVRSLPDAAQWSEVDVESRHS